jgi:hypothetical protein
LIHPDIVHRDSLEGIDVEETARLDDGQLIVRGPS